MTSHKPLRWGILSAGKICNDFCVALTTLPKEDHVVTHVAARSVEKAKEFAAEFSIEKFSGSYEAVVMDTNVDAVYVGAIHTKHKELSLLALDHGKAVLCEKPAAMNSRELEEVLKKAEEKNLFFMEAVWTRCFPLYEELRSKATKEGSLGEPLTVFATFGFEIIKKVERVLNQDLGGSVLLDIGCYTLAAMDMFFQGYPLIDMKACGHVTKETNVDRSVGITATFEGNRIAQLLCSGGKNNEVKQTKIYDELPTKLISRTTAQRRTSWISDSNLPNEVTLICEKGTVKVSAPFWSSESYTEDLGNGPRVVKFELPKTEKKLFFVNSVGLRHEAEHVRQCLIKGLKQSPIISHDTSRRIMGYMDDIRRQIGSTHAL